MMGCVYHQFSNTTHDQCFQIRTVNPLNYCKVNLHDINLIPENVRQWFLIQKWKIWLGNLVSSLSCLKKKKCIWRSDKLEKE